jgi:amino acid transporter
MRMAYVSQRFHTPVYAILFNTLIAEFLLYLYSFNVSIVSFMAGTTLGYIFTFGSTAIAGILVPFLGRTRGIYESSGAAKKMIGIPLITLLGIGSLGYFAVLGYGLLTNGTFGVNSPPSLIAIAAFWIIGAVVGTIFIRYRKKQGIDINSAFSTIPPE